MAEAGAMQVRLVDANVLIVASAVDEGSPFRQDATPWKKPRCISRCLTGSKPSNDPTRHAVLDVDWHVCGEYATSSPTRTTAGWP